ncbi:rhizopuspepsin 6 precursor [Jimgerdemannia flammicorona]|uniref:rhizopuspepsin n=1 Tax=Jimgerdemannia flammicorona TaxID=994334 RepID=A0A433B2Q4_9FUNG|nr:rhizopuspepsin 6 precursor [Jimgerdemannia flammicorona]
MKITFSVAALMVAVATIQTGASLVKLDHTVGFTIGVKNNPEFAPNATKLVFKAWSKYSKFATSHRIGRYFAAQVPVTNHANDLEYYATVKVGTPGQNFKLDFDTGSSDLWFPYTKCGAACKGKSIYDPKKSSTYKKDGRSWNIQYGDGSTSSGILGRDTVVLGGIPIANQTIDMADRISAQLQGDIVDGILGLGFDSGSTVQGTKTPMTNLIQQKLIKQPIFGVYLGKASRGGGGAYIFGGYDKTKLARNLTTVPVDSSQGYWAITVSNMKVNGTAKAVVNKFQGIVDTGTTLLLLPNDVASNLAKNLKAADNGDGTFTITCNPAKLQDVTFSIAGATFKIAKEDLIFQKHGTSCIAGFGYSSLPFAILGDVFIKNNYVVFNQKIPQIQLAPLAGM